MPEPGTPAPDRPGGARLAGRGPDAVALVLVGDELLLGHVVDTNAAWLGRRLSAAGLRVVSSCHAPDEVDAVAGAVRRGLVEAPNVLVSGGLGPTSDDVTRAAVAAAAGVSLVRDASVEQVVRQWFGRGGRPVPAGALRMADLPVGALVLDNGAGSAPGVRLDVAGGVVYAVPGVPGEMQAMVDDLVLPDILGRAGRLPGTANRTLRVVGLGESAVAGLLAPLESGLGPGGSLAFLVAPAEVQVRLRAVARDAAGAETAAEGLAARARALLGDAVAAEGDETVAGALVRLLRHLGATMATAESLTGGLVGAALTDVPGSSSVYRGSVVAYATEIKAALLGVDRSLLAARGAVDAQTAIAMAHGARDRLGTTYALATSGVAGPEPQEGHQPGTLHLAVAGPGRTRVASSRLNGDRAAVRRAAVALGLDLVRRAALGLGPAPGETPGASPGESGAAAAG